MNTFSPLQSEEAWCCRREAKLAGELTWTVPFDTSTLARPESGQQVNSQTFTISGKSYTS